MSATLEDSTKYHWEEGGRLSNHVPLTQKEIREFDDDCNDIAKISNQMISGKKITARSSVKSAQT